MTVHFKNRLIDILKIQESQVEDQVIKLLDESILIERKGSDDFFKHRDDHLFFIKDRNTHTLVEVKTHQYNFKANNLSTKFRKTVNEEARRIRAKAKVQDSFPKQNPALVNSFYEKSPLIQEASRRLTELGFALTGNSKSLHLTKCNLRIIISILPVGVVHCIFNYRSLNGTRDRFKAYRYQNVTTSINPLMADVDSLLAFLNSSILEY